MNRIPQPQVLLLLGDDGGHLVKALLQVFSLPDVVRLAVVMIIIALGSWWPATWTYTTTLLFPISVLPGVAPR